LRAVGAARDDLPAPALRPRRRRALPPRDDAAPPHLLLAGRRPLPRVRALDPARRARAAHGRGVRASAHVAEGTQLALHLRIALHPGAVGVGGGPAGPAMRCSHVRIEATDGAVAGQVGTAVSRRWRAAVSNPSSDRGGWEGCSSARTGTPSCTTSRPVPVRLP